MGKETIGVLAHKGDFDYQKTRTGRKDVGKQMSSSK
jgi:hypothetical protein